jgi:WD repeat-containing protein 21A
MPAELPGFYFDADRNRYFPLRSKCAKTESEKSFNGASSSTQGGGNPDAGDRQEEKEKESEKTGVLQLIQQREFLGCGQGRNGYNGVAFRRRLLESQTSHPQVWEYNGTNKWADGALQQLRVSSQTNEGEKEADVLVLGGSTGRFG